MSIREAVLFLANELAEIAQNQEPGLLPSIYAIASITNDEFESALDDWEEKVMETEIPSDIDMATNKIYKASEAIFDLGRCNMYCEFNQNSAIRTYNAALSSLNALGSRKRVIKEFDLSEY